eukprot:scaffold1472_cov300-Pinguiococcus_pyrenoidosus.AAC.9
MGAPGYDVSSYTTVGFKRRIGLRVIVHIAIVHVVAFVTLHFTAGLLCGELVAGIVNDTPTLTLLTIRAFSLLLSGSRHCREVDTKRFPDLEVTGIEDLISPKGKQR